MEQYIDLHVHSCYSDGRLTPAELVSLALENHLAAFALTDHDTTDGIQQAQEAAAGTGLEVIPGIELSTDYCGKDIHILGLGVHTEDTRFQEYLKNFRNGRDTRNIKMIEKLAQAGIDISPEKMKQAFPAPDAVWTRAHFGRYLLEKGYVRNMNEAFERYIGDHGPCFVPRKKISSFEAIKVLHQNHALALLAHPLLYGFSRQHLEEFVAALKKEGLDGLEVYYSRNHFTDGSRMRALAEKYGLLPSGGSDFHGSNKPDISLGTGTGDLKIPYSIWEALKKQP